LVVVNIFLCCVHTIRRFLFTPFRLNCINMTFDLWFIKRCLLVNCLRKWTIVVNPPPYGCYFLQIGPNHLVITEQPLLLTPVVECHDTHPFFLVIRPLSFLHWPIRLLKYTETLFLAVNPLTHLSVESAVGDISVYSITIGSIIQKLPLKLFRCRIVVY